MSTTIATTVPPPSFVLPTVTATQLVSCQTHADGDGADLVFSLDFTGGANWAYGGNWIGGDQFRFTVASNEPTLVAWTVDFGQVKDSETGTIVRVPIPEALVLHTSCGGPNGRSVSEDS